MTIDEVIKHCEEVAEEKEQEAQRWMNDGWQSCFKTLTPEREVQYLSERKQLYYQCLEYASEHRQLAKWLTELQILRIITEYLRDSIGVFDTVDGKVGIETDIIEWAKEELTVKEVKADE